MEEMERMMRKRTDAPPTHTSSGRLTRHSADAGKENPFQTGRISPWEPEGVSNKIPPEAFWLCSKFLAVL